MSLNMGYLYSSLIFLVVFAGFVTAQISAKKFQPLVYWATIIATTTVGTTLADFADRSLGMGYAGGAGLLSLLLLGSVLLWYRSLGTIAVESIQSPASERFYWVTILFSQTLGTALGDWTADTAGLGYDGGALIFSLLLGLIALAHFRSTVSKTTLFWFAFVLTRPLGAVLGDFLDKPVTAGGLALSRYSASGVLLLIMGVCLLLLPQRPATKAH